MQLDAGEESIPAVGHFFFNAYLSTGIGTAFFGDIPVPDQ